MHMPWYRRCAAVTIILLWVLNQALLCAGSMIHVHVLTQVMEQNPKLAKQSRVLKVSMDAIYDFAITQNKDKKAAGVVFRFMPDAKEVQSALEVLCQNK